MPAQRAGLGSAALTQCGFRVCAHKATAEASTGTAAPDSWQCCMALPSRKIGHWSTVVSPKCEDLVNLNGSAVQIHKFPWMNKHQLIIADFYPVTWQMRSKLANSRNLCSVLMRFPEAITIFQHLISSRVV